jgi:hypothetical protein
VRMKMTAARTRAAALPPSIKKTFFVFALIPSDYPGHRGQRVFLPFPC